MIDETIDLEYVSNLFEKESLKLREMYEATPGLHNVDGSTDTMCQEIVEENYPVKFYGEDISIFEGQSFRNIIESAILLGMIIEKDKNKYLQDSKKTINQIEIIESFYVNIESRRIPLYLIEKIIVREKEICLYFRKNHNVEQRIKFYDLEYLPEFKKSIKEINKLLDMQK